VQILYEMITGQMLYLEEDLHKLLDMARKADIASPTTLRRGIPAQLERIVMHALARQKEDRYQSAGDFATDLERFLHAYSPISTSSKVAALIKKVIGDPVEVPDEIEIREGPISTHQLDVADIVHSPDELRDENSMIFKLDDLKPQAPVAKPAPKPIAKPVAKRDRNEPTREVQPAPLGPVDDEDSGLLPMSPPPPLAKAKLWDTLGTDELDNVGENTMVTGAPNPSFMMMDGDGVEATMVTGAPEPHEIDELGDDLDDSETLATTREKPNRANDDDGGPTVQRDFARSRRATAQRSGAPPPALAAKIHAPAVSELRKPKPSRKTPSAGVPNVLQQIVGAQRNEPMPAPSPMQLPVAPPMQIAHTPEPLPAPPLVGGPAPLTTPPPGTPLQMVPGVPPHLAPYQYGQPQPPPQQTFGLGYPTVTPGSLYQLQNGQPPMSPTGQLRLFEADELPAQYRMSRGVPQWLKVGLAGALAVSVAAGVTFFIIRSMQSTDAPALATVHVDSVPHGADVYFDGMHLAGTTPLAVPNETAGKTIEIRVELAKHKTATEQFQIPADGGDVTFMADLKPLSGKLVCVSKPDGADLYIDGRLRGRTPVTISDVDLESKQVELRLKDYQPYTLPLKWPASGEIDIDAKLVK
jgi:serine/threonine-protein kinase